MRSSVIEELRIIDYQDMDKLTVEMVELMHQHMVFVKHGYKPYAITVTFLPHRNSPNGQKPEAIKRMMINLYLHQLVRDHLFNGHGNWPKKYGEWQPFALFFMEEHGHKAVHRPFVDDEILREYQFAERLHYHGIMFVDPIHEELMDQLIGENTINRFNRGVMTSDVKCVRDIGWTGYQMKFHERYADTNLCFGQNLLERVEGH